MLSPKLSLQKYLVEMVLDKKDSIQPEDIYNFYYMNYILTDPGERQNLDPDQIDSIRYEMNLIKDRYLKSFTPVVQKQLIKYHDRGRMDVQAFDLNDIKTNDFEVLHSYMQRTFRSDMKRRNTNWENLTVNLAELQKTSEVKKMMFHIDRINNAIHNAQESMLVKFINGDELQQALSDSHHLNPEQLKQKTSDLGFLKEEKEDEPVGKAYVFDVDDTLIKSGSKVKVVKDGEVIRKLNPKEFNTYKKQQGEVFDFSEFDQIIDPKKYKAWPVLENINKKLSSGKSNSTIYILTARASGIVDVLEKYLTKNGITQINRENIFAIGDKGGTKTVAEKKRDVLEQIKTKHDGQVTFFDDAVDNIELAKEIGVKAKHITEEKNLESLTPFFEKRTKAHIDAVKKEAEKLELKYHEQLVGLIDQVKQHDASKFKNPERDPYIWLTEYYRSKAAGEDFSYPEGMEEKVRQATMYHVKNNSHHPEYHDPNKNKIQISSKRDEATQPSGIVDATRMPILDIAAMVCDWVAMGKEKGNTGKEWADKVVNKRWKFTPKQTKTIYQFISDLEGKGNLTESILDEPQKEMDQNVWEGVPPRLKQEIFVQIANGLLFLGEDAPITKLLIAGSLTGLRWTEDSDLDVTVILDISDEELEELKSRLPEVNGEFAVGTTHPINYFLMNQDPGLDRFDSAYEPLSKEWLKQPRTDGVSVSDVYDKFRGLFKKIDLEKAEAKRSIVDIKLLEKALENSADPRMVAEKIVQRIQDLDDSLGDLAQTFKSVHKDRDQAFSDYEKSGGGPESPNMQPENIKYKMLERYHYLDFLKQLYKLMKKDGVETPEGFEKVADLLAKNEEIITTKFNEEDSSNVMYHITSKDLLPQIQKEGLKINPPRTGYSLNSLTYMKDVYGMVPVFLGKTPWLNSDKQIDESEVILEVNVQGLKLVADIPSLVDKGAYMDDDGLYWEYGEEPKALKSVLDGDGHINFDEMIDPTSSACQKIINFTKTVACLQNITPDKITVTERLSEGKYEKMSLADIIKGYQGKTLIAFDTETTGLEPNNPDVQITEIAGVAVDDTGKELGRFHKKIKLRSEDVRKKPIGGGKTVQDLLTKSGYDDKNTEFGDEKQVLKEFSDFVNQYPNPVLLAHNLQFDMKQVNTALKRLGLNPLKAETLDTLQFARVFFEAVMNALEGAEEVAEVKKIKDLMRNPKGKLAHTLEVLGNIFQIKNEHWHSGIDDTLQLIQIYPKLINWFIQKSEAGVINPELYDKELRSALKRKRSLQAWSKGQTAKDARAFRRSQRRQLNEEIDTIDGDKALAMAIGPIGMNDGKAFLWDRWGSEDFIIGSSISGHTPLLTQMIKRIGKEKSEEQMLRGYWFPKNKTLIVYPYIVGAKKSVVEPDEGDIEEVANQLNIIPSRSLIVQSDMFEEEDPRIKIERKLSEEKQKILIDFIKYVEKEEGIETPIKIVLQDGRKDLRTTGVYSNHHKTLKVNIKHRALVDVLRTLAHELVHHRQNEMGEIEKHPHQDIGGPIEDEANAKAGIYIKKFAKETGTDIYSDEVNILEGIEATIEQTLENLNAAE